VGHTFVRLQGDIVARLDEFALWQTEGETLHDLLGECLGDFCGGFGGGEDRGDERIFKLRVECLDLLSQAGACVEMACSRMYSKRDGCAVCTGSCTELERPLEDVSMMENGVCSYGGWTTDGQPSRASQGRHSGVCGAVGSVSLLSPRLFCSAAVF
jgi:hypothetical protein